MKITQTGFNGLVVIEPKVFGDNRGHFFESFNQQQLSENGIDASFIQDNQSYSTAGVVRGLHYQNAPYAQTKLVRVLVGRILDVVVDLRVGEPTFGKSYSIELSAESKLQLYVPKGFAHGFSVLGDSAEILYKCDNYYHKESEGGLLCTDPALMIDWRLSEGQMILSDKDKILPVLSRANFKF